MDNQKSLSLKGIEKETDIPKELQKRYIIKRIKLDDIEISARERDIIHQVMAKKGMFILLGEYTVMINSITAIDPKFGANNIPPAPELMSPLYDEWKRLYHPANLLAKEVKHHG